MHTLLIRLPLLWVCCCRDNYLSTQRLMQFSSQFVNLRAFVHTSTFFVNNYLPRNSLVKEQIYPLQLQLGGKPVDHKQFVTAIMDMHPQIASRVAAQLMQASILLIESISSVVYRFSGMLYEACSCPARLNSRQTCLVLWRKQTH
eukprot:GHUV01046418.1.p1 GENE.GHUV01046418.1~~GHUV01046418.1.p1  ORF type:complete len:145 (-),score=29.98 GHUV01046418.1:65-499(-)